MPVSDQEIGQYNCKTVPGTVPPHLKPGASKGEDKGNQRRKGPGSSHPRCNGERWKGLCQKGCHASLLEIDGIEYERRCYQSMTGVTHRTVPGYSSPAQCLENECTGDDNCLGIEWAFNVANVSHRRAREFSYASGAYYLFSATLLGCYERGSDVQSRNPRLQHIPRPCQEGRSCLSKFIISSQPRIQFDQTT